MLSLRCDFQPCVMVPFLSSLCRNNSWHSSRHCTTQHEYTVQEHPARGFRPLLLPSPFPPPPLIQAFVHAQALCGHLQPLFPAASPELLRLAKLNRAEAADRMWGLVSEAVVAAHVLQVDGPGLLPQGHGWLPRVAAVVARARTHWGQGGACRMCCLRLQLALARAHLQLWLLWVDGASTGWVVGM